jgi:hypothetical protein
LGIGCHASLSSPRNRSNHEMMISPYGKRVSPIGRCPRRAPGAGGQHLAVLCRRHDEVLAGVMLLEPEQLDGLVCADVHPSVDADRWRRAGVAGIDEIHVPPGGAGRAAGQERLEARQRRAHAPEAAGTQAHSAGCPTAPSFS